MCTELLLALLYFITILIVNYFLYKLLAEYTSKIIYLLQLKNILTKFTKSESVFFFTLYSSTKKQSKVSLKLFNNISSTKDVFLIGNTYRYLGTLLKKENNFNTTTLYYLELLENQYLSNPH